jgi:hypothetical protein
MLDRRETALQGLGREARDARLEVLQRPHLCATASVLSEHLDSAIQALASTRREA